MELADLKAVHRKSTAKYKKSDGRIYFRRPLSEYMRPKIVVQPIEHDKVNK